MHFKTILTVLFISLPSDGFISPLCHIQIETHCVFYNIWLRLTHSVKDASLSPCIRQQETERLSWSTHNDWQVKVSVSFLIRSSMWSQFFLETEKSIEWIVSKVKDTSWMSIEFRSIFPCFRRQSEMWEYMLKCFKVSVRFSHCIFSNTCSPDEWKPG